MTDIADQLDHAAGCPAGRIEHTRHGPDRTRRDHPAGITTVRCLDCAAHWPPPPRAVGPLGTSTEPHHTVTTGGHAA